jgi:hypothetical protein
LLRRAQAHVRRSPKPDAHQKAVKFLVEAQKEMEKWEAGATRQTTDFKGKIVEYCFYMQKQGYSETTIRLHRTALKIT